jgi:hypothetical protein
MKDLYPYEFSVKVRMGSDREVLVRKALNLYGLADTDTTTLLDYLLRDINGIIEYNNEVNTLIAEYNKKALELKMKRIQIGGILANNL